MTQFKNVSLDGVEEIELGGFTLRARVEVDENGVSPWVAFGLEKLVTGYLGKPVDLAKHWVLDEDPAYYRGYCHREALKLASRENWAVRTATSDVEAMQKQAVLEQYRRWRAWVDGNWYWVGVVIEVARGDVVLSKCAASVWGIESDAGTSCFTEMANEFIPDAMECGEGVMRSIFSGWRQDD